jgi:hypothetical protein
MDRPLIDLIFLEWVTRRNTTSWERFRRRAVRPVDLSAEWESSMLVAETAYVAVGVKRKA